MSSIDIGNLKSVNDESIPSEFHQEEIGIIEIKFDTLFRFGKIIQHGRIINNDAVNPISFRVGSAQGAVQQVPPSSDESFDGWFSKIFITPNAVTGNGLLELDLVSSKDARKNDR